MGGKEGLGWGGGGPTYLSHSQGIKGLNGDKCQ